MQSLYIDPFTDFGFKKLFGEEASKRQLIDFLNALLELEMPITDLTFKNTEQLGATAVDRKAVYDIYCENERGERFIVELQKTKQGYFKERTLYYSTFPIVEQAEKGEWDFALKAVYCVALLDFTFGDDGENAREKNEVVQEIMLRDKNGKIFYNKLRYVYVQMPYFHKQEEELASRLDKWLYFIKNLEDIRDIPRIFKNDVVFEEAFAKAALVNLSLQERASYEYGLKAYRDNMNTMNYSISEAVSAAVSIATKESLNKGLEMGIEIGMDKGIGIGMDKGLDKGIRITAKGMRDAGIPVSTISHITRLTEDEINAL